jgi:hypothetical protein
MRSDWNDTEIDVDAIIILAGWDMRSDWNCAFITVFSPLNFSRALLHN